MTNKVLGLHHITAIAGDAQRNHEFYTKLMGLRMVKKTVNFDNPSTYHFYYGNEHGTPGTIMTFFPWEGAGRGDNGVGMITEIAYSVPGGSLDFWENRFKEFNVPYFEQTERFGETYLPLTDYDGLRMTLVIPANADDREPWKTSEISKENATRGFHNITLSLKEIEATAKILVDIFGYRLLSQEGNRYRFITDAVTNAAIVDLLHEPHGKLGIHSTGTNHHVAFRVLNEVTQMNLREKILSLGLSVTPKINRDYFFSVYFREPGGVLFEIATDNPGFTVDEPLEELGTHLRLPRQFEPLRNKLETVLPFIK